MDDKPNQIMKMLSDRQGLFDADRWIFEMINDELKKLRFDAQYSEYHRHVRRHGYPLSNELKESSGLIPRPDLEQKLENAILKNMNAVILGCEGSGKTTLIQACIPSAYVAG